MANNNDKLGMMIYAVASVIRCSAITAHNLNKYHCEKIGDTSQKPWEETPHELRVSAVNGITSYYTNPNTTPQMSHQSWMTEKIDNGWVYGEVKDIEKKTHPCLVPYTELSEHDREKDKLFSIVGKSSYEHFISALICDHPNIKGVVENLLQNEECAEMITDIASEI